MKLTVVGCSGSFPGPDAAASSYLVEVTEAPVEGEADGGRTWRIVLDLGSGSLGPLQRLADPFGLDAVVLSHLHPDHFMDMCGLYVARRYDPEHPDIDAIPPLRVHGPVHTAERLLQAYGPDAESELPRIYDVHEMADGKSFTVGPVTITPRLVQHPVTAFGLRLEYAGRVIAYSGDTDACPALVDLARGADLLLCEASFEERRNEPRGIHLTGLRAGEAAAQSGAARLMLTHIPVWTDQEIVLDEAREAFAGPIDLARPGLSVNLGADVGADVGADGGADGADGGAGAAAAAAVRA